MRLDSVTIPEPERRRYEDHWLPEEQARETTRNKAKPGAATATPAPETDAAAAGEEAAW